MTTQTSSRAREKTGKHFGQCMKDYWITRWKLGGARLGVRDESELTAIHLAHFNLAQVERDMSDFDADFDADRWPPK